MAFRIQHRLLNLASPPQGGSQGVQWIEATKVINTFGSMAFPENTEKIFGEYRYVESLNRAAFLLNRTSANVTDHA